MANPPPPSLSTFSFDSPSASTSSSNPSRPHGHKKAKDSNSSRRVSITSIGGTGGYSIERDWQNPSYSAGQRRAAGTGPGEGMERRPSHGEGGIAAETKRCEFALCLYPSKQTSMWGKSRMDASARGRQRDTQASRRVLRDVWSGREDPKLEDELTFAFAKPLVLSFFSQMRTLRRRTGSRTRSWNGLDGSTRPRMLLGQ